MIRFIIILVLLSFLINPVYAGNKLQQNYENKIRNGITKYYKFYSKIDKTYLIEEDCKYYKQGDSSLIGDMLIHLKSLKEKFFENESDVYYIDLIIKNLNRIATEEELTNPIIIEDKRYITVSEKVKEQIAAYNYAYADLTSRKEKFKNTFLTDQEKLKIINEKAFFTSLMSVDDTYNIEELLHNNEKEIEKIEKLYANYKANPNNMKSNEQLVNDLIETISQFQNIKAFIENEIYDECYQKYLYIFKKLISRENFSQFDEKRIYFNKLSKDSYIRNFSQFEDNFLIFKLHQRLIEEINKYKGLDNEIYRYSYNYEKNKYYDWAKQNNKKMIRGSLGQFVYQNIEQPLINSLYIHNPKYNLFMVVQQSVPGGVILTGKYLIGNNIYSNNPIFLQTNKKFADGAIITEKIIAEYKGFYDYTTVLGSKKRIYKFYRYGENEIKNNFYGSQNFYFYSPY